MTPRFTHDAPPFAGRREELARFLEYRRSLDTRRDRPRHLLLIESEEGGGRSRLADEFLSRGTVGGSAFGGRSAYAPHVPYAPLAPFCEALDELLSRELGGRRLASFLSDPAYRPLLARLPLVQMTLGLEREPDPDADARLLAPLIAGALSFASRFRPVLLVVDDLHRGGEREIESLQLLNDALRNDPVLVVVTSLIEHPLAPRLRTLLAPSLLDLLSLTPLTSGHVARILTETYGPLVSAHLTARLARASGGVPRHIVDIVDRLVEGKGLVPQGEEWGIDEIRIETILAESGGEADPSLTRDERRALDILDCCGGEAERDDLVLWLVATSEGTMTAEQGEEITRALEERGVLHARHARPSRVTIASEALLTWLRSQRRAEDLVPIASLLLEMAERRLPLRNWLDMPELLDQILRRLPPPGSPSRDWFFEQLASDRQGTLTVDEQLRRERLILTMQERLESFTPLEQARVLYASASIDDIFSRHEAAHQHAERLYRLTSTRRECHSFHAMACARLAFSRFYVDRSSDISQLLDEGERALVWIDDGRDRMGAEYLLLKARLTTVPVDRPAEAIAIGDRALALARLRQDRTEEYHILCDQILRLARMRDEERLRARCRELLQLLEGFEERPPVILLSNAIRAALNIGDIFLARRLFAAWMPEAAPVETRELIMVGYLQTLFALNEGDPSGAADKAIAMREEVMRLRRASADLYYEVAFSYAGLRVYVITSLIAAGRFEEGRELVHLLLDELPDDPSQPDVALTLRLQSAWLEWRVALPMNAYTSLLSIRSDVREEDRSVELLGKEEAVSAATRFRQLWQANVAAAPPPSRFIIDLLAAELEGAHEAFDEAMEALDRCETAVERVYSWRNDLEGRTARLILMLRRATRNATPLAGALDLVRQILTEVAERGLVRRIEGLRSLLNAEAARYDRATGESLAAQVERIVAGALENAHDVLRNSRNESDAPLHAPRLHVMGPLRLMRPYSYLELTDTAFGRETARTLLAALVAARLQGREVTREELATRISQKAVRHEQQKKLLYNAASAARAACGNAASIQISAAGGMELNIDLKREGGVWVDAIAIVRGIAEAEELERAGDLAGAMARLSSTLGLARRGEFAPELYADWVDAARDRVREELRRGALLFGRLALRTRRLREGIEALALQLERDPFDEEAHRLLALLQNEGGNRSAALKQLALCRDLLERELGVGLEPESEQLLKELSEVGERGGERPAEHVFVTGRG